jgi:hypothetical protein
LDEEWEDIDEQMEFETDFSDQTVEKEETEAASWEQAQKQVYQEYLNFVLQIPKLVSIADFFFHIVFGRENGRGLSPLFFLAMVIFVLCGFLLCV